MSESLFRKPAILIIEDEPTQRHILTNQLIGLGYEVVAAANGNEGLATWAEHPNIRLVLTDLAMPAMDGVEVVKTIRAQEKRYTYLMVLTSIDDKEWLLKALAAGADDFVHKPILREELELRLQGANRLLRLEDQYSLVGGLAELAAIRAGEERVQVQRLKHHCFALADDLRRHHPALGLNRQLVEDLANVSVLHDIGIMNVPDSLLNKRGRLTEKEIHTIREHAQAGGRILYKLYQDTGSSYLLLAHEIASNHHERWDGSGYPNKLRGEDIPLSARIVALADTYNALRSRRPYKDPMPRAHTESVIAESSGTHFDPMVVESFLRVKDRMNEIHEQLRGLNETW